jgi:hypothetical protein
VPQCIGYHWTWVVNQQRSQLPNRHQSMGSVTADEQTRPIVTELNRAIFDPWHTERCGQKLDVLVGCHGNQSSYG